jgi:hypothetical protein
MTRNLLAIYLNDHLAGATGGLELARRARGANEGTPLGEFLERLAVEIEEDRESLLEVMKKLGVRRDPVKVVAGWTGEKMGRLKLNGQVRGYSPLSRVIELEGLHLGVTGKLELWRTLQRTSEERLAGIDLEALVKRAETQRRGLATHRRAAVDAAFAGSA